MQIVSKKFYSIPFLYVIFVLLEDQRLPEYIFVIITKMYITISAVQVEL